MTAKTYETLKDAPPGLYRDADHDIWIRRRPPSGAVFFGREERVEWEEATLAEADQVENHGPFTRLGSEETIEDPR